MHSFSGPATFAPLRRLWRRRVLAHRRGLGAVLICVSVVAALRVISPPPPERVLVLVARRDLVAGDRLRAADTRSMAFTPESVPAGVTDDPVGRVLAAPMRRGEPFTDTRFVGPALAGTSGMVAIPVRLPDAGAVALLRVGDRIDVIGANPKAGTARVLAAGAVVLAIPRTPDSGATAGLTGRLVVVGVPEDATPTLAASAIQDFLSYRFSR